MSKYRESAFDGNVIKYLTALIIINFNIPLNNYIE